MVFLRGLDDRPVCDGVVGMWSVPLKMIGGKNCFLSVMTARMRLKRSFSFPEVVKKARDRITYAGYARENLNFR